MDAAIIASLIAILVLLLLSAFFSGSETALTASSRALMHHMERDGNQRAKLVNRLLDRHERMLGGILLGNNLVNILASALATSVLIQIVGNAGVAIATVVMTALVLIFAEVLPKTYALRNPDRVALRVAPILGPVIVLLSPIVEVVRAIITFTLSRLSRPNSRIASAEDELRGAFALHTREGGIVKTDRDMLDSILDLSDLSIEDIMVHRKNMAMVELGLPNAELVGQILAARFTRVPLWRDDPENIVGVLHMRDLLKALHDHGGDYAAIDVPSLARPPWFVPETTTLREQLTHFRTRHEHFALVVDEYGDLMGLVTLEDILEEIVGDISDEHDVVKAKVRRLADGTIDAEGDVTLRDLNRQFDWELPDDDAATIAGLVITEMRKIPDVGERVFFEGFTFEVAAREGSQITHINITPPPPGEHDEN